MSHNDRSCCLSVARSHLNPTPRSPELSVYPSQSAKVRSTERLHQMTNESSRCWYVVDCTQASTKYLHQRLLVVLVSPPLPGIITKHRLAGSCASHRGGRSDSGGHGGEHGDEDSSTACTSESEDESLWSDDDPDRESPYRSLITFGLKPISETTAVVSRTRKNDSFKTPLQAGMCLQLDQLCRQRCADVRVCLLFSITNDDIEANSRDPLHLSRSD